MKKQNINISQDYKYGFITDIENIRAPKGLSEQSIKFISDIKKEPKWMLDWRLKAFDRLKNIKEPNWQKPKYPKIDYQNLYYYSAPKSTQNKPKSLDRDRKFLTQGEVFSDDQIDAYIALKFEEIYKVEHTPHPIEFEMYYSS